MAQQLTERPPTSEVLTLPRTLRAAARILAANTLHQGDFLADVFNRESQTPHAKQAMSIVAALNCAATGDPRLPSAESRQAIASLAHRLLVNEEGPYAGDELALAFHVDAWGDVDGRTTESAVAVLEQAADDCEVSA